jgi:hypothetical protein
VDWLNDQLSYQRIRFTMTGLSDMLHTLVSEGRTVLGKLMMAEDDSDFTSAPAICWDTMEDDHSEDRVGYSFLRDDRNSWLAEGEGWIVRRLLQRPGKRAEWLRPAGDSAFRAETRGASDASDDEPGTLPYQAAAVRSYEQQVERFREGALAMMHMLGGMPGRSTEVMGIRHSNTANGGVRNIMIDRGMVCFITSYHKNYRSSEQVKVIHRYVPREVGELLVWYLWLVLPFWQQVQGMARGANEPSAFLWAREIVTGQDLKR